VRYLGLSVSTNGISLDEDEMKPVGIWSQERKTKNGWLNDLSEVQQFLMLFDTY